MAGGKAWTGSAATSAARARQPQQGTSNISDMHQQAQQLRAAAEGCWNFGDLRLQNNRQEQQLLLQQQQEQPTQAAWRRQHQHQHRSQ